MKLAFHRCERGIRRAVRPSRHRGDPFDNIMMELGKQTALVMILMTNYEVSIPRTLQLLSSFSSLSLVHSEEKRARR